MVKKRVFNIRQGGKLTDDGFLLIFTGNEKEMSEGNALVLVIGSPSANSKKSVSLISDFSFTV